LTPFPSGNAKLALLAGSKPVPIGETFVSVERQFESPARGIEQESWKTQRLVLRLESSSGKAAQGFVSIPDFAHIAQRAGSMLPRFFAILAGQETPEDVAAIMNWFLENPTVFPTEGTGGTGHHAAPEQRDVEIPVSALLHPTAGDEGGPPPASSPNTLSWRRFMETVLACFREPRGPIVDLDPETDGVEDDPLPGPGRRKEDPPPPPPKPEWPLRFLEKLLDRLLAGSAFDRGRAFWMTHFVCDRIEPDATRIAGCLERVLTSFADLPPVENDREAVAGAALIWAHLALDATSPSGAINARRKLLQLGVDLTQSAPDITLVRGFTRVLAPDFDIAAVWDRVRSVKTAQEEVKAFRMAGKTAWLGDGFSYLKNTPEFQTLTEQERGRIRFMLQLTPYCPNCNLLLATADLSRLREGGVVCARCCGHILLCEEV